MVTKNDKNEASKKLSIKLTRGVCAADTRQLKVLHALGLKRTNNVVNHSDSPIILGMINKVRHLVTVTENK
ncbi:MAG: 50S ribosomal protein L30 [Candidatus Caenarcaniphilales bacterium]|jgi:large subunit ribosomal protein L30|nr:50S ribosomal protein L30 [Candidatus Caenarcaniphilales bacterium]